MEIPKVWILQSLYRNDDKTKPINWATAVFATEELAETHKQEIGETRDDIEEVYIQEHYVCCELPKMKRK